MNQLKLIYRHKDGTVNEYNLNNRLVTIGRSKKNTIQLTDPLASICHCQIHNGYLEDCESRNGTRINNKLMKTNRSWNAKSEQETNSNDTIDKIDTIDGRVLLNPHDKILCGETEFIVEQSSLETISKTKESKTEDLKDLSIEEFMTNEFKKIIGQDAIKLQLRQFYKKVRLDRIRQANGKAEDQGMLFHMVFSGPPGKFLIYLHHLELFTNSRMISH